MVGMELVTDRDRKTPADEITKALIARVTQKGLLMISAGTLGNVIRPLMPLTIEDELVERGLDIIRESLGRGLPRGRRRHRLIPLGTRSRERA